MRFQWLQIEEEQPCKTLKLVFTMETCSLALDQQRYKKVKYMEENATKVTGNTSKTSSPLKFKTSFLQKLNGSHQT